MDIIRKVKNSNMYPSQTTGYGIIKIAAPCDLACALSIVEVNGSRREVLQERFSITCSATLSVFNNYVPDLNDWKIIKYTNNMPYLLLFLKIIDNVLYLCISSEGEYELSVKQLSGQQNAIENAYIYPVTKDGTYKNVELSHVLQITSNAVGKFNLSLDNASLTAFTGRIEVYQKVLKINQTNNNYPSLIDLFGFANNNGPCHLVLNYSNGTWYVKQRGFQNVPIKADNRILYLAPSFMLFTLFTYTGFDQFSVELVDKPSNWDSMPVGNVVAALDERGVNSSDITANNQLLNNTVTTYIPTKRCGTVQGNKMYDADGYDITYNKVGTTSQRPTLSSSDVGFQYFDTTLSKPIWWTGSNWVDAMGTTV